MNLHRRTLNTLALEVLDDPFANEVRIDLGEDMIRKSSPSMPDTKAQDLIRAANQEKFDKQEGVNEKFLLDKEIVSIASTISAELGPFALDAYEGAQKLVQAGALKVLNEGTVLVRSEALTPVGVVSGTFSRSMYHLLMMLVVLLTEFTPPVRRATSILLLA